MPRQDIVRLCKAVLVLDEEPLVPGTGPHEGEGALELLAAQEDAEFPGGELGTQPRFGRGAVREGVPSTFVR